MSSKTTIALSTGEEVILTHNEMTFAEHYLADPQRNATQAAIRAGYSKKTATSKASQLLTKVNVKAYLDDKMKTILERLGIDQERVLLEHKNLAFSDVTDHINSDYSLKRLDEMERGKTGAIKTLKITEKIIAGEDNEELSCLERKVEFSLYDKTNSLNVLTELVGLKNKENEPKGQVNNFFGPTNNYIASQ